MAENDCVLAQNLKTDIIGNAEPNHGKNVTRNCLHRLVAALDVLIVVLCLRSDNAEDQSRQMLNPVSSHGTAEIITENPRMNWRCGM